MPTSNPKPAGSLCSVGGSQCDGMGLCVECLAPADCAGADDACQTRTCMQGKCGKSFTAAGAALPAQKIGDCLKAVCDGNGATLQVNDDTDLPDDKNACTDDVCTAGVPSTSNKPQGTACGAALLCDSAGACVGCNSPSDCPGADDECKLRTCVNSVCGVVITTPNTPIAAQTEGDCLEAICDGRGNIASIPDSSDLPPDDGNACTSEACNGAWRATLRARTAPRAAMVTPAPRLIPARPALAPPGAPSPAPAERAASPEGASRPSAPE